MKNVSFISQISNVTCDAILPRKGPVTRTMSKRLQEDWARAAEEGPRVFMNLRSSFRAQNFVLFSPSPFIHLLLPPSSYPWPPMVTHLLLEVASPLSLPSPFHCNLSSKKQRNPLMKKILGLQAPMELTSCGIRASSSRGVWIVKDLASQRSLLRKLLKEATRKLLVEAS
ncbi:hypothetical protein HKD37_11G032090 [Glycine soja]